MLADCVVRAMVCHIAITNDYGISNGGATESRENPEIISTRFAHIHALELAQKGSIPERKLGECATYFALFRQKYSSVGKSVFISYFTTVFTFL